MGLKTRRAAASTPAGAGDFCGKNAKPGEFEHEQLDGVSDLVGVRIGQRVGVGGGDQVRLGVFFMNELQARLVTNWENARKRRCRIGKVTPKAAKITWHTRPPYQDSTESNAARAARHMRETAERRRNEVMELPNFVEFPATYGIFPVGGWLLFAVFAVVFGVVLALLSF